MAFRFATAAAHALAGALLLAMPTTAAGAAGATDAEKAPPAGRELHITEPLVAAFVDAAVTVERIGASWKPKVQAAGSQAEAKQLVASAHTEMRQAVEAAPGISVEQYAAIARAAQKDPQFGQELKDRIAAKRAGKN
jgi:hypothetical protein